MNQMTPLDKFGQFVMRNLRDRAIGHQIKRQAGEWRSPAIRKLQKAISSLPKDTQGLLLRCVSEAVDNATHDFLLALQDAHDRKLGIEVLVDGTNVAEISDGLHGESFGANGWIQKYSEHAAPQDDRAE